MMLVRMLLAGSLVQCFIMATGDRADPVIQASGIPRLYVKGTHYEIGCQTGRTFRDNIWQYNKQHPALRPLWLPWSSTPEGQKVVAGLLHAAETYFPHYVQELRGMAFGVNLTFTEMFLANHPVELSALLPSSYTNSVDSCTDLFVNHPETGTVVIGHNEDNIPLIQNKSYLLSVVILDDSGQRKESFTSYCYPGQLPGSTFGFNSNGVVTTVNALYPTFVDTTKVGRNFLTRAMLTAGSMRDIFNLTQVPSAYGFSYNVAILPNHNKPNASLYNIEVAPTRSSGANVVSVQQVLPPGESQRVQQAGESTGNYFHVNMYRRLSIPELTAHTVSSIHRTTRIKQFPAPHSVDEVLSILGDTQDRLYPIYRTPRPTDNETTLATAIFDLQLCRLSMYLDRPSVTRESLVDIQLPCYR